MNLHCVNVACYIHLLDGCLFFELLTLNFLLISDNSHLNIVAIMLMNKDKCSNKTSYFIFKRRLDSVSY